MDPTTGCIKQSRTVLHRQKRRKNGLSLRLSNDLILSDAAAAFVSLVTQRRHSKTSLPTCGLK